jgi:drug/metabolite transporter (DMT)-like permease
VILINIINSALLLKQRIKGHVVFGAMVGVAGIASIFWSEVTDVGNRAGIWQGLWMCLIATFFASIGNILSARNQKNNLPVVQTNAWGMAYGSLFMLLYALSRETTFNFDPSFSYSLSLVYLSLFGSIFAFGSYLTLIGRIGADKTAYAAVLFPVIALLLSTLFEDYHWTQLALFGFSLVLIGNYLVLMKPARGVVVEVENRKG